MAFFKDETLHKIFSSVLQTDRDDYQYGNGFMPNISEQQILEYNAGFGGSFRSSGAIRTIKQLSSSNRTMVPSIRK